MTWQFHVIKPAFCVLLYRLAAWVECNAAGCRAVNGLLGHNVAAVGAEEDYCLRTHSDLQLSQISVKEGRLAVWIV